MPQHKFHFWFSHWHSCHFLMLLKTELSLRIALDIGRIKTKLLMDQKETASSFQKQGHKHLLNISASSLEQKQSKLLPTNKPFRCFQRGPVHSDAGQSSYWNLCQNCALIREPGRTMPHCFVEILTRLEGIFQNHESRQPGHGTWHCDERTASLAGGGSYPGGNTTPACLRNTMAK